MSMTVRDILMDAGAFRRAYPSWPHPEPEKGFPMTPAPCWADPLTRDERRKVAEFLARASRRSWEAAAPWRIYGRAFTIDGRARLGSALTQMSAEMSDLHLDVTERAQLPPDHPVTVQARKRFAELTEMSGDPEWLGI